MKRILFLLFMICCLVFLLACNHTPKKLTIGLIPIKEDEGELISNFKPMKNHLEKSIGVEISVIVPNSYRELIMLMQEEKVDIAWYGPFSYIAAEKELKLEPMVLENRKSLGSYYHSLILSKKESAIKTIEDLKGKKFAYVDPMSTSGFVIPYSLFKSRNINQATYFSDIIYSGSHDLVPNDILTNKVDAGAIADIRFLDMVNSGKIKKDDFHIIWTSSKIPGSPFVARENLDKKLKMKFKSAMLSIHEDAPEAMNSFDDQIVKYEDFDRALFNDLRNISTILGDAFIGRYFLNGE